MVEVLRQDPSEVVLRDEIEKLALRYPTYGYRRITKLLGRMGYPVGYKRVARLMKAADLSVSVKRVCQTTTSFEGGRPWANRLKDLEVYQCDQVWVDDITYVRLKAHFIYVCLLMDVFTRMIRAWQLSQHLSQSLTLKPLKAALCHSVCEIHHSDQGVQYLSSAYIATLEAHRIEISVAALGCPWENGMPKDSSARSRRKKFTSMTTIVSLKPEIASVILSHRCIIRNAPIRR